MGNSTSRHLSRSYSLPSGGLDGGFDRRSNAFIHSPLPLTRSTSETVSFKSYRSAGLPGQDWNETQMLVFTNDVRAALAPFQSPIAAHDDRDAEQGAFEPEPQQQDDDRIHAYRQIKSASQSELKRLLSSLLGILVTLVQEERAGVRRVDVDFIVHTHFDMLLAEISNCSIDFHSEMKSVAVQAGVLERLWKNRLGMNWRLIKSQRFKEAKATGPRKGLGSIILPPDWRNGHEIGWVVEDIAHGAEAAGGLGFPAGQWWLNIYCTLRDGVISSPSAPLTRGRPGITALAMTSGEEIDGISGTVEYTKEGHLCDMPIGLLGNQCPIRVLRGSQLKSKYAPKVGVRYDGLYKIQTFSFKLLGDDENQRPRYQCKAVLERLPGQVEFETALKHPTHSELDHWNLYLHALRKEIAEKLGDGRFMEWVKADADEKRCSTKGGK